MCSTSPAARSALPLAAGCRMRTSNTGLIWFTKAATAPPASSHCRSMVRQSENAYIDVRFPIVSPQMAVPAIHSFEVEAAGRYDHYSDFGDTENPKVSGRWQPFENESVTFRASYGTSFQAPSFSALGLTYLTFPDVAV